jgi:hypothetical protein
MYATAVAYRGAVGSPRAVGIGAKLIPHFKWMGPALILFGLFLGWQGHVRAAHRSAESLANEIGGKLTLPLRIDEVTRLDAIQGHADVLSFHYTILAPLQTPEALSNIKAKLQARGPASACANADLAKFLNAGYSLELRYSFLESAETASVLLPAGSCKH